MSALLGGVVFALALWGLIDIVRRIGRGLAAAARFVWRGVQATARGIGAWWRRKALSVARGKDSRENGMVRLQAETNALLAGELADAHAELKELRARHTKGERLHDRPVRAGDN